MRFWRPGVVTLAWVAATALGAATAWVGLRPVLDAAVPDRSVPLSAADVRHLARPSAAPVPVPSLAGPATATPPPSSSASARPGRSPSVPPASTPPPVVVDGWTVTTLPDGTPSYLRSFQVPGGSTVIRMTPGRVYLVSASPNPDYTVTPIQNDPGRLVVQFVATGRSDIVDAIWWNGAPYAQVSHVG